MKKFTFTLAMLILASCLGQVGFCQGRKKVELLSLHETVATFEGVAFRRCMGRTARCPDKCGDSGEYATFKIVDYLNYEKPGKYGDPKAKTKRIQITDFHKKPVGDPNIAAVVKTLKKGDKVLISWKHNYVTENRVSSPRRPITKFEKATP